ncbi:MAG: helix-turn-helix transcriptional regulator [Eubacteriales bacterium]
MTIGERIAYYRKKSGLTQRKLAELSGVNENSIRKYELDKRNPKYDQVKKLSEAMNISEGYILDSNWDKQDVETVGDFMSVFFALYNNMNLEIITTGEGTKNPKKAVLFHHPKLIENFEMIQCFHEEITEKRKIISEMEDQAKAKLKLDELNGEIFMRLSIMKVNMIASKESLMPTFESKKNK